MQTVRIRKPLAFPDVSIFRDARWVNGMVTAWLALATLAIVVWPDPTQGGLGTFTTYLGYAARNAVGMGFVCLGIGLVWISCTFPEESIVDSVKAWARELDRSAGELSVRILTGLLSFAVMMFAYSAIKVRLPEFAPFAWDIRFADWDRALFAGRDPWTLFTWMYDSPILMRGLDTLYDVWAGLLVAAWTAGFVLTDAKGRATLRFPIALILTWFVGGNVMAALMSSAGPVYFEAVTGLSTYNEQLASLSQMPLRANDYQAMLWGIYESSSLGLGGISAMPSMHCATAALILCAVWTRPALRLAAVVFFAVIFVGSFVLAWHYAVDGLLAVPVAMLAWWSAGHITRWGTMS